MILLSIVSRLLLLLLFSYFIYFFACFSLCDKAVKIVPFVVAYSVCYIIYWKGFCVCVCVFVCIVLLLVYIYIISLFLLLQCVWRCQVDFNLVICIELCVVSMTCFITLFYYLEMDCGEVKGGLLLLLKG